MSFFKVPLVNLRGVSFFFRRSKGSATKVSSGMLNFGRM
jgi:hypothetical protein